MITYTLLNKSEKYTWLPRLFDLYYINMCSIAPSVLSREDERTQWLASVSPALDKAPRQILLCCSDGLLSGFIQYYTRGELLMIEEVQLTTDCQHSTVFLGFIRALIRQLPREIRYVEAYADKRNRRSIDLMHRLGMQELTEAEGSPFLHFKGNAAKILPVFTGNKL